jgi:hypothetical protein
MSVFGEPSAGPREDRPVEPAPDTPVEPIAGGLASKEASRLRQSISQAAEQIDSIIGAAETAAREIQAEASREAERYLAESRREAEAERARVRAELSEELADLRTRLVEIEATTLAAPDSAPEPEPEPEIGPDAPAELHTAAAAADPDFTVANQDHALAVIRAAQLAIAGTSRAEIERTLREQLGVDRADEIVDQILPPS